MTTNVKVGEKHLKMENTKQKKTKYTQKVGAGKKQTRLLQIPQYVYTMLEDYIVYS